MAFIVLFWSLIVSSIPVVSFSPDETTVTVNGTTYHRPKQYAAFTPPGGGRTFTLNPGIATVGGRPKSGYMRSAYAAGGWTTPIQTQLNSSMAGDTIYLNPGIYRENLTFPNAGTIGNPITLSCAPGTTGQAIISPPSEFFFRNPGSPVIQCNQPYIQINGLGMVGGLPYGAAPEHFNANGISFNTSANGPIIQNCWVYGVSHCGFKAVSIATPGVQILGNVAWNGGTNSLDHGVYDAFDGWTVDGNIIWGFPGAGVQIYHGAISPVGTEAKFNVLFSNGEWGIILSGASLTISSNTLAYNGAGGGLMFFRSTCTGNTIQNNIMTFNGNGVNQDFTYDNGGGMLGDPTNNATDYCDVYTGSIPAGASLNGNTVGAHMLHADPLFVDGTNRDLRLQGGSPCIGAGLGGVNLGAY